MTWFAWDNELLLWEEDDYEEGIQRPIQGVVTTRSIWNTNTDEEDYNERWDQAEDDYIYNDCNRNYVWSDDESDYEELFNTQ